MINIKSITRTLLGVTAVVAALGVSQQAVAGIADTKHNLGSSTNTNAQGVRINSTTGTAEICVFCHTPHASNTSIDAPLWNKGVSPGAAYTLYSTTNSATIDGEVMTTVGSISLACLSCHDGGQAMDNMVNAPGSGGYTSAGARAEVSAGVGYTWTGANMNTTTGVLTGVANLTKDLSNDHPIGIQYCGGGITGTAVAGCVDPDFQGGTSGTGLLKTAEINSTQVWWVDTGGAGRQKTDMILYNQAFAAGTGPSVECGTCHDPHTSTQKTFLRIANTGSAVCLACHVK